MNKKIILISGTSPLPTLEEYRQITGPGSDSQKVVALYDESSLWSEFIYKHSWGSGHTSNVSAYDLPSNLKQSIKKVTELVQHFKIVFLIVRPEIMAKTQKALEDRFAKEWLVVRN